jgi:protein ImuB
LGRVRARFGNDAVVQAVLRDGHLPEARFGWEPLAKLPPAAPKPDAPAPLVRRLWAQPIVLPPRPAREPDGWLLRGLAHGPVQRFVGPYVLSGGWWRREIARDYYFTQMKSGEIFWIYYDERRRTWFLQGQVA